MSTRARPDRGFTLVEVLIVVVLLGMLAGVVVLATRGITDNASEAACDTDRNTIITAEETHYGLHRTYATEQELVDHGLLQATSDLTDIELTDDGYTLTHTGDCSGIAGVSGGGGDEQADEPTPPPVSDASGQPIGSFAALDYCASGQTDWTTDFGDGNWLQETWHPTRWSIGDYGAQMMTGELAGWTYLPVVDQNWGLTDGPADQADRFFVRYTAAINVAEACALQLRASGDDGFVVLVDDQPVVEAWGYHPRWWRDDTVQLEPGSHTVEVRLFENWNHAVVSLEWSVAP